MSQKTSPFWSSKLAFILAASGSAVGLGNIWRFPYLVAKHGGGTFILMYLLFAFIIGSMILLAEFVIGRYIGSPVLEKLKNKINNNIINILLKALLFLPLLILTFYFIVCGWTLSYVVNSIIGNIQYHNNDANYYENIFSSLLANNWQVIGFTLLFMLANFYINFKGLIGGVEKANLYMLPLLFFILIVLIIRSLTLDGAMIGVNIYFSFDSSLINSELIIDAIGQAFFSLSTGMGIMVIFASYVRKEYNLVSSAFSTVVIGTALGLFSAMLVLPAVYAFGFNPNAGPGLTFITLPAIFSQLSFGVFFAIAFFLIMLFAAITSTISLVEATTPLFEHIFKITRNASLLLIGILVAVAICFQAMSFNILSGFTVLNKNLFELTDFATNALITCGAFLICIIVGYIISPQSVKSEITSQGTIPFKLYTIWYFCVKYIIPIVILVIFASAVGII